MGGLAGVYDGYDDEGWRWGWDRDRDGHWDEDGGGEYMCAHGVKIIYALFFTCCLG